MNRDTKNLLIGLLAGAAVGAGSAMIFSPMTGEETRGRIGKHYGIARDRTADIGSRAASRAKELGFRARDLTLKVTRRNREESAQTTEGTQRFREQAVRQRERRKINLNRADREELISAKGVGPVSAEDIMRYRDEHGGFRSVNELDNIRRFTRTQAKKVKEQFYV